MPNVIYSNFYLSNEIEDQYNSHLDLARFCKVDNSLVGTPGMIRKINRYRATNGTQILAMGVGNTQTIEVAYAQENYTILLAQNRFAYYDEEQMTDPMTVPVGTGHQAVDLFNQQNADIFAEFNKATQVVPVSSLGFDGFVDAIAMMNFENIEGVEAFAFVSSSDMAALRKALGTSLQYVEAFARQGYVGTVGGVNVYIKKDAVSGTVIVGTRDAVTLFNKKGTEVEQERDANVRQNTIYARKYYIAALTDETKAVKILKGTAAASTDTSVSSSKTYYEKSGAGYVAVTPEAGDNPQSKGWYEITAA